MFPIIKMGFLDSIFGRKKDNPPKSSNLNFDRIDDWLENELQKLNEEILRETEPFLLNINSHISEVEKTLKKIEKKKPSDKVPSRFKKIIRSSKPKYLSGMRSMIDSCKPSEQESFDQLTAYNSGLGKTLEDIAKINFSEGRYLGSAYGEELASIQKYVSRVHKEQEEIDGVIKAATDFEILKKISMEKQAVLSELIGISNSPGEADELRRQGITLEKKRLESEKRLKKLCKSKEYLDLQTKTAGLEEIRGELNKIEGEVYSNLNPLGKVIRKYKKICLEKEIEAQLNLIIEDPVSYYLSGEDDGLLEILVLLEKIVEEGKIDLKDADKQVLKINNAKKYFSEDSRRHYSDIVAERIKNEQDIEKSDINSEKATIEDFLKTFDKSRNKIEKKIEEIRDKEKTTQSRIKELKQTLSKTFKEEYDIKVKYSNPG